MTDLIALAKQANGAVYTTMFDGWGVSFNAVNIQAFAELIRQDEREKCAVLCDGHYHLSTSGSPYQWESTSSECAAAIRARTTT